MTQTASRDSTLPFLYNIQALRGVAAVMVLLSHLYIIEAKSTPTPILGDLWEGGRYGVDLFFVISGFIMVYVTRPLETGARRSKAGGFLYSRVTRIYPLYWLISAALLAVYLLRPQWVFGSMTEGPDVLRSFALWPHTREPLLAVGWTLVHEMGFYIVFALSLLFARKWLGLYLVLWALAVTAGQAMGLHKISPELKLLFHPLTFEFLAGAFIALYFESQQDGQAGLGAAARNLYFGLALLGVLAVFFLPRYFGLDPILPDPWTRVGMLIAPASLCIWALVRLDMARIALPRFMARLGDWSYALYLSHVLTLSAVSKIWMALGWSGPWVSALMLCVMIIASLWVAALLYYGFERPMLALTRAARNRKNRA